MAEKREQIVRTEIRNLSTGGRQEDETSFWCANAVLAGLHRDCQLTCQGVCVYRRATATSHRQGHLGAARGQGATGRKV